MSDCNKIGVLTYTEKHRKTYDVLCLLKAKGYENVEVYARPYHYKKKYEPRVEHRPSMYLELVTEDICKNLGYKYRIINEYDEIIEKEDMIFLMCGAGILPEKFVNKYKVINAHPGYIPNARGLDALKWAVAEKEPIGVTTHIIGDLVDAGDIIRRERVALSSKDTFHTIAQKVYEMEIKMLVEAVEEIKNGTNDFIDGEGYIVHKRMPNDMENNLYSMFEEYKVVYLGQEK